MAVLGWEFECQRQLRKIQSERHVPGEEMAKVWTGRCLHYRLDKQPAPLLCIILSPHFAPFPFVDCVAPDVSDACDKRCGSRLESVLGQMQTALGESTETP